MTPTDTYLGLRAFVDELARCGVREACTSPGSRNTPLLLSLAREPRLRATSHIDERCGGFFALGLAKATQAPGRAGLHERDGRRQLPAGGRRGAGRRACRCSCSPPTARPSCATSAPARRSTRSSSTAATPSGTSRSTTRPRPRSACAGCASSPAAPSGPRTSGRPGPVHLNFALREPLVLDDAAARRRARGRAGRAAVDVRGPRPRRRGARRPARRARSAPSGRSSSPGASSDPAAGRRRRAPTAGVPLLADPLSGARRGAAIAHYDAVPARRGVGGRARARPRDPRRRPADLQAAAAVARRPRTRGRSRWTRTARGRTPSARRRPSCSTADPATLAAAADGGAGVARRRGAPPTRPRSRRSPRSSAATRSASRWSPPAPRSRSASATRSWSRRRCRCATSRRSPSTALRAAADAGQPRRERHRRDGLDRASASPPRPPAAPSC